MKLDPCPKCNGAMDFVYGDVSWDLGEKMLKCSDCGWRWEPAAVFDFSKDGSEGMAEKDLAHAWKSRNKTTQKLRSGNPS